ncbi:YceI family protein [Aggregicoccus sp. 17bor-14]|uniref:YceI family protein n=1 Tax=Myxococcaceae TaxID=31 RepID=UPI00129C9FAB|nr:MULTISPECIES: YceI family protein [Myxococcaceae]MBF5045709.1 YceI family protein [Simulacricoccus sp. 17bor-14]MRI91445.1 YceI family protein [Aggregicoccus sp. 17bor-14]
MRKRFIPLILGTLAWAGTAAAQDIRVAPGASLAVDGDSTVRAFSCKAQKLDVKLQQAEGASLAPDALASALTGLSFELPLAQLDCANDTMNEHMRKAMQAEAHPTIGFKMSGYTAGAPQADGRRVLRIRGDLTLAGNTRPVELTGIAASTPQGLRVQGRHALRMTEWGVKPPSLMLGTMKVREDVVIRFDVALEQQH